MLTCSQTGIMWGEIPQEAMNYLDECANSGVVVDDPGYFESED